MKSPDKAAASDSYAVATRASQVALLPLLERHAISPSETVAPMQLAGSNPFWGVISRSNRQVQETKAHPSNATQGSVTRSMVPDCMVDWDGYI